MPIGLFATGMMLHPARGPEIGDPNLDLQAFECSFEIERLQSQC